MGAIGDSEKVFWCVIVQNGGLGRRKSNTHLRLYRRPHHAWSRTKTKRGRLDSNPTPSATVFFLGFPQSSSPSQALTIRRFGFRVFHVRRVASSDDPPGLAAGSSWFKHSRGHQNAKKNSDCRGDWFSSVTDQCHRKAMLPLLASSATSCRLENLHKV